MIRKKKNTSAVADEANAAASVDPTTYHLHCCSKRCARKRQETTTTTTTTRRYLPQDIVIQFLLHLPAQILFNVTRHACREWSIIIRSPNFAHCHLRNSTSGLLIQSWGAPWKGFYLEMRRGRLEICDFKCAFEWLVQSSCNGLVLMSDFYKGRRVDYVTNPLTKQLTIIPRSGGFITTYGLAAAYVEDGDFMVYKVVRACHGPQIQVLTIGVDEVWRDIDITHLLLLEEEYKFNSMLVVSGGYAHLVAKGFVLTLNVETEIARRFSFRPSSRGNFLPMGSDLSFVSSTTKHVREVWEMSSVTGEWTLLFTISKRRINYRFRRFFTKDYENLVTPLCWLVVREVLVFGLPNNVSRGITYNVKTGEIQVFEWGSGAPPGRYYHFTPHVNSLVWWERG